MFVTYIGAHDEVEFYEGQIERRVKQGEAIEVLDVTAHGDPPSDEWTGLLAQTVNWRTSTRPEVADLKARIAAATAPEVEAEADAEPPVSTTDENAPEESK